MSLLNLTVDGLPMGVTELPGSAAPGQDLGGIERLYRWEVPFSAEEIRTVRSRMPGSVEMGMCSPSNTRCS